AGGQAVVSAGAAVRRDAGAVRAVAADLPGTDSRQSQRASGVPADARLGHSGGAVAGADQRELGPVRRAVRPGTRGAVAVGGCSNPGRGRAAGPVAAADAGCPAGGLRAAARGRVRAAYAADGQAAGSDSASGDSRVPAAVDRLYPARDVRGIL